MKELTHGLVLGVFKGAFEYARVTVCGAESRCIRNGRYNVVVYRPDVEYSVCPHGRDSGESRELKHLSHAGGSH